jgi:hypothetical protein
MKQKIIELIFLTTLSSNAFSTQYCHNLGQKHGKFIAEQVCAAIISGTDISVGEPTVVCDNDFTQGCLFGMQQGVTMNSSCQHAINSDSNAYAKFRNNQAACELSNGPGPGPAPQPSHSVFIEKIYVNDVEEDFKNYDDLLVKVFVNGNLVKKARYNAYAGQTINLNWHFNVPNNAQIKVCLTELDQSIGEMSSDDHFGDIFFRHGQYGRQMVKGAGGLGNPGRKTVYYSSGSVE